MYTSALKRACPCLSQEYPPLPVDLRFGSPFTITDQNPSAYIQGKPWASWRSSPSPTDPPPPPPSKRPSQPPVREHLSPTQQQQMKAFFQEFSDIISQGKEDLGCTPLLQHMIETEGQPLRQLYRRQNPAVRREEMTQVQQILSSGVIRPSNSPWASPVAMVKKKDCSLQF